VELQLRSSSRFRTTLRPHPTAHPFLTRRDANSRLQSRTDQQEPNALHHTSECIYARRDDSQLANHDVLVLTAASSKIASFADVQAKAFQAGVYTVLPLGTTDQIYLYNVVPSLLTANDFIFT
jgi:hypothetical protein